MGNSLSLKTKPQQQQRSAKKKTTTTTSAAVEAAVMHEQTTSSTSSPPPSLADAKINMQLMNHIKAQMTQALAQLPAAADDDHIAASVVNQTIDSAIKSYIGQQHQQQQQQQTKAVHDKTGVVDTNEKQPQSIDTKSVSCSGGSMSGYSQQRKDIEEDKSPVKNNKKAPVRSRKRTHKDAEEDGSVATGVNVVSPRNIKSTLKIGGVGGVKMKRIESVVLKLKNKDAASSSSPSASVVVSSQQQPRNSSKKT